MPTTKRSSLLREITPPVLVRLLRPGKADAATAANHRAVRSLAVQKQRAIDGRERDASFYDENFHRNDHWMRHYTESRYYPLWALVADRIARARVTSIVDLGCGAGQVAVLMRDKGVPRYLGVDFSEARVARARDICPEYEFLAADIFQSDVLRARDYDAVLATEFLEHIDRDLDVLDAIRPGTHLFATVPNFGAVDHVRHFQDADQVRERYGSRFCELDVQMHRANTKGTAFFLMDGIIGS